MTKSKPHPAYTGPTTLTITTLTELVMLGIKVREGVCLLKLPDGTFEARVFGGEPIPDGAVGMARAKGSTIFFGPREDK